MLRTGSRPETLLPGLSVFSLCTRMFVGTAEGYQCMGGGVGLSEACRFIVVS